jgi:hypothetical protein
MFEVPVLFLVFNRPDLTARVFESIRFARPQRLYIAADGPRKGLPGEPEKCEQTRRIATHVDWECEVKTLFNSENLGCRMAVSGAIDWFFVNETEGVILEDDCLPHPSFFPFCQDLLERHRQDQRVAMISGNNFQGGFRRSEDSYYFSRYAHTWGWASWRDRWQGIYDLKMSAWPSLQKEGRLRDMVGSQSEMRYWRKVFDRTYRGEIDTWDYQWIFSCWLHGMVTILPNVNLVTNLGFGPEATHTTSATEATNLCTMEMEFPLIAPATIVADHLLDQRSFRKHYNPFFVDRLIRKLKFLCRSG